MDIANISTAASGPVPLQEESEIKSSVPENSEIIMPPLAAFNTMGGESMEIKPEPKEDVRDIGGQEVSPVASPQPAFNNTSAESAAAMLTTSTVSAQKPVPGGRRVRDYLRTVKKRAQTTSIEFRRLHLPYRFQVVSDDKENVLLILTVFDGHGKVIKDEIRDVTNDDFDRLMDDLSTGKGLLIDDIPHHR